MHIYVYVSVDTLRKASTGEMSQKLKMVNSTEHEHD